MNHSESCAVTNSPAGSRQVTYVPPVQVYEGADAFELVAEIPGADDQSTEISIEKGVLTLSARVAAPKPHDARLTYSEFSDGCYRRTFELSDAVDPAGVEATVAKGVVTVRLPKAKVALPQKVRVIAG